MSPVEVCRLTEALLYAADAHRNQRRKGAAQEPYINHLIEVLDLVAQTTGGADTDLLVGAVLHDVLEDTSATYEDVEQKFGARVAKLVRTNSDDMSLQKSERRRARILAMPDKSTEARIVKIADVISNLRAIGVSPPAGWSVDRKLGYLESCRQLIDAGRGANSQLEQIFDVTAVDVERAIREGGPLSINGNSVTARHLESEIGQKVHVVYLANTECRVMAESDVDRLCELISRIFPSATVQPADGIYEGRRRSILMARIRTDSTDAVVALAQQVCVIFEQRFVGVEVSGRYIRIYADDTL
jgi:hypothetical protein